MDEKEIILIAARIVESNFPYTRFEEVPKTYLGDVDLVTKGSIQNLIQEGITKALSIERGEKSDDMIAEISERSFPLTNKMKEAKAVVLSFIEDYGRPPSYQELADNLGVSKTTAYFRMRHMRRLMNSH